MAISSFFPVLSISLTSKWHPAGGWWVLTWSNIFYDDTTHVEGQKGLEASLDKSGNFWLFGVKMAHYRWVLNSATVGHNETTNISENSILGMEPKFHTN